MLTGFSGSLNGFQSDFEGVDWYFEGWGLEELCFGWFGDLESKISMLWKAWASGAAALSPNPSPPEDRKFLSLDTREPWYCTRPDKRMEILSKRTEIL